MIKRKFFDGEHFTTVLNKRKNDVRMKSDYDNSLEQKRIVEEENQIRETNREKHKHIIPTSMSSINNNIKVNIE